jgi:hypothetical protein
MEANMPNAPQTSQKKHKVQIKIIDVATGEEHTTMEMTVTGIIRGYCCCSTNWVEDGIVEEART